MKPLDRKMFRNPRATSRATGILASSAPLMTAAQRAMAQGKPMRARRGASVSTTAMPNPGGPFFQNRILDYFGKTYDPSAKAPGSMIPGLLAAASPPVAFRQLMGTELGRPQDEVLLPANVRLSDDEPGLVTTNVRVPPVPPAGQGEKIAASAVARQDPSNTPTAGDPGGGKLTADDQALIAAQGQESESIQQAKEALSEAENKVGDTSSVPSLTPSTVVTPSGFNKTNVPGSEKTTTPETKVDPEAAVPDSLKNRRSPGKSATATKETAKKNDEALGISPVGPDGKPLTFKERVKARYDALIELGLGEDEAKDIRSDKSYNLMMLGLRIAAGQDPNALTNIATAGAEQLQEFGEVTGEQQQREAERKSAVQMLAVSDVSEEMKNEAARKFARDERIETQENQSREAAIARTWQAGQNKEAREFQYDMNMFDKHYASMEKQLDREHTRAAQILGEEYANQRAKNEADLRVALANAASEDQFNLALANYEFQAEQAAIGRVYDLDKLILTQKFAKEQGVDEREFRYRLASLPGETQRLYEEYLTPDQISTVLTKDKSGKTLEKDRTVFVRTLLTNQDSRQNAIDAIAQRYVEEQAGLGNEIDIRDVVVEEQDLTDEFNRLYDSIHGG